MKPSLITETTGGGRQYTMAGDWTADFAEACLNFTRGMSAPTGQKVQLVCDGLQRIDITGAWIMRRQIERLKQQGALVDLVGFKNEHEQFILQVDALALSIEAQAPDAPPFDVMKFLLGWQSRISDALMFVGWCWVLLFGALAHPLRFRFRAFVKQCEMAALRAMPIVGLITFLIAIVLTYQGSSQLKRFGAEVFTVNLVVISILREMGVLLTAIMIAGRSGSAFAAEIGAMKLNEEIDALKTTGLEPMEVLVLPRIVALTLMMPLLTFLADMTGIFGAGLFMVITSKTSWLLFQSRLSDALVMKDFWIGIGKAPVFGFIIAIIGCYHGMSVTNSAESVGRETTRAVVNAIFAVMLADALFSIIFTNLGL